MLKSLRIFSRTAYASRAKTAQSVNDQFFRGKARLYFSTINPSPKSTYPTDFDLNDLEAKASAGNVEDMLRLGKMHFEEQRRDKAELWLCKAASNDNLEAQFLAGLLLTSTPATGVKAAEKDASNKTEVRDQIMKLRKESMFAKRSQSSNLNDFQAALRKRREKLAQQEQSITSAVTPNSEPLISTFSGLTKELDSRALGLEWLQRAALSGHAQAMCLLGNELLAEGQKIFNGEPSKEKKVPDIAHAEGLIHQAVTWYQLAVTEGKVAAAAYNLGVLYHDGVQHSLARSASAKVEAPAAAPVSSLADLMVTKVVNRKGAAPVEVTQLYSSTSSSGVSTEDDVKETHSSPSKQIVTVIPVDLEASLSYFQQAAALGESAASLWCGYCYSTGEGGVNEIDADKAVFHLFEASNCLKAHRDSGIMSDRSASEKEGDVQTAAKADYYLSQIYLSGLDEQLNPDRARSLHHLQLAVAGQDEDGLYTLADLHLQHHLRLEGQLASHLPTEANKEEDEGGEGINDEDKEERLEVEFLQKDVLRALQQESVAATAGAQVHHDHVHSASCGSGCGHQHGHNHNHGHHRSHDHHHHSHKHDHDQHHGFSAQSNTPHDSSPHQNMSAVSSEHSGTPTPFPDLPVAERSKQHLLRAVKLLVQASSAGQAQASLTLGALTYQGLLPPQRDEEGNLINNKRRAFEFYQLAAEQGSLDAWRNLASMHYLGDGVPKSVDLAKEIMKVVFGKK